MAPADPVVFEVIWHKLMQLAEEMGITYFRTTGSHVVITGTDASSAIMTPNGEAVTVGPYIVTQANVLPLIVRSVIEQCSEDPGINPGDVFICNDPYAGAIHQQDVATVAPVFDGDTLIGWVGTSGHQVDNGGIEPGGFAVGAKEVHQEGLRIPPVKLVDRGVLREDLMRWIDNEVRDPLVVLDVRAQLATLNVGRTRLLEIVDRYGSEALTSTMSGILDYSEERFVEKLKALPEGRWERHQYIDHDGHEPNIYRISCAVENRDGRLKIDFSGSSANARGIINSTYAGMNAAILSALYITMSYDMPWNSGIRRCLDVLSSPGTINNAAYPAPITMATISATVVTIDVVWACVTDMLVSAGEWEESMANWSGTSLAPVFTGETRDGEFFAHTEMSHFGGGGGARTYRDGVDTAGIVFNTTPNIPNIESVEQDFPVLYLYRRHLRDSGGPGRYRGGMSAELAYVAHKGRGEMETLFSGTGCYQPNAIGLGGGMPGASAKVMRVVDAAIDSDLAEGKGLPQELEDAGGVLELLEPKHARSPLGARDIWYHCWQAGGGYGDPLDRDPELVVRDLRNGAISAAAAEEIYGVVLDGDSFDAEATAAKRKGIRADRLAGREIKQVELDPAGEWQTLSVASDGSTSCGRCGEPLGDGGGISGSRPAAVRQTQPLDSAGPGRGQDYGDKGYSLTAYFCPGCGASIDVELAYNGDRLIEPPPAPTELVAGHGLE